MVSPELIPLDNCSGPPDWYEFYPILNFFQKNSIEKDSWYGFFSPKFTQKTGLRPAEVIEILSKYGDHADVALFSPNWDQLAYFKSPFEQGEFRHPGIINLTQKFLEDINCSLDLRKMVTCSSTSVYSNFIVAKANYWKKWIEIATPFQDWAGKENLNETYYLDSPGGFAPMKTFIQERFPSIILTKNKFKVMAYDFSQSHSIHSGLFDPNPRTRKILQACDLLKENFLSTNDQTYLEMYFKVRNNLAFKGNYPSIFDFSKL
jgi:hypothetical protein